MDYYDFRISAEVLDYQRKVFGMRPYDEVVNVIAMYEQGRKEQDEQRKERAPMMVGNGHDRAEEQRACS